MTEAMWLACMSPREMLDSLRWRTSSRKLRLFGCACLRRVWHFLTDRRGREAVEFAERYAEGNGTEKELEAQSDLAFLAECAAGKIAGKGANRWACDAAK